MPQRLLTYLLLAWVFLLPSSLNCVAQSVAPNRNTSQWAAELAAFAREDSVTPPPTDPILFYGSSSIRMWSTLPTDFPGLTILNRGFGGSRFPDAHYNFEKLVAAYNPRQVVLYEGDNDIAAGATPQQVYESFLAFEKLMRQHRKLRRIPVVFLSIKPSVARWALYPQMQEANRLIREYIARHPKRLRFVDVGILMLGSDGKPRPELYLEDGLHMTRAGYDIWARALAPVLVR